MNDRLPSCPQDVPVPIRYICVHPQVCCFGNYEESDARRYSENMDGFCLSKKKKPHGVAFEANSREAMRTERTQSQSQFLSREQCGRLNNFRKLLSWKIISSLLPRRLQTTCFITYCSKQ